MNFHERMQSFSDQEIAEAVRNRLPLSVLADARDLGLTEAEIDSLVIPQRTRRHRAVRSEPLTIDESDKVMRLLRIVSLTRETFGEDEKALAWLRRPLRELGGESPLMMSGTEAGGRVVETILAQIAWGAAA
jgi:putative toxin-antitoxin system antitoxin component (TIGR02293 family)